LIIVLAVLTFDGGTVAIHQKIVKRMLAYSASARRLSVGGY
jgi:NADH:ubiquinone oxidoreductase subunit 2 (subunit N)